jgi:3-oxoacyl-[acyl-carrier protein] reductase
MMAAAVEGKRTAEAAAELRRSRLSGSVAPRRLPELDKTLVPEEGAMEIRSGRPLSRRSALGGLGAAAALPLVGVAASPATRTVEGRIALVTGSGRNLGRATVLELARRGADVIVNARSNMEEAESVAAEARALGVRAVALLADVGVEAEVNRMVEQALERLGRVDILINNAGFRGARAFTQMTTEEWRAAAAVNCDGPFFCTKAVVPSMIANRWGRIITVSGLNSWHGRSGWAHVCASKMGAVGMTRALSVELAPHNILVNHVVPGTFLDRPDLSTIPAGRIGVDQELANTYAFLCSDDASYITGQTLHVNGGEMRY